MNSSAFARAPPFANLIHAGAGLAIRDILGNAAMEQQRFLRHIGDLATQRLLRALGDVLPIKKNAPLLNVGQAQQKLRERGLPRAGKTYRPTRWPAGVQFELVEHLRFRIAVAIRKANALPKSIAPSRTCKSGAPATSATSRGSSSVTVMPLASPNARLKRCRPLLMKLNWFVTV